VSFVTWIEDEPLAFLESLPEKTQHIVRTKLSLLKTDPWPGKGGDKEKFSCRGKKPVYRLHISHSYTALYRIENDIIFIFYLDTIERAHKKYGRL
jgi:mRNA-degrading endonuclease RelE of RelBE toxin-antitoxin system